MRSTRGWARLGILIAVSLSAASTAPTSAARAQDDGCRVLHAEVVDGSVLTLVFCLAPRPMSVVFRDAAGTELWRQDDHAVNTWSASGLVGVRRVDLDRDGVRDLVVCATYMPGAGPDAAHEYPICDYWLWRDGRAVRDAAAPGWAHESTRMGVLITRLRAHYAHARAPAPSRTE